VSLATAETIVARLRAAVESTGAAGFGAFAGLHPLDGDRFLAASTDGVGTKLILARERGRLRDCGADLAAHCINDVATCGAEPLILLDYVAAARIDPEEVAELVEGAAAVCREAGVALVGGETAELPGLYAPDEYDLAGFAVGIVERSQIIDGTAVKPGDVVLGLASSGLHSNGYSLARRIVFDVLKLGLDATLPGTGRSVGEVLLEPTRIYVRSVLPVRERVHAMAHVTGGGITGNLPRVLPEGCRALIQRRAWSVPAVFATLGDAGHVADAEMFRTFNMGIGYLLVVPSANVSEVIAELTAAGESVHALGEITTGERGVELV
jgi:phosphoribosylformylglycinamidine cyclo-ligase